MEDTNPLTETGHKILLDIDNRLNDPNFPDLIDIALDYKNITKEEFLNRFKFIKN